MQPPGRSIYLKDTSVWRGWGGENEQAASSDRARWLALGRRSSIQDRRLTEAERTEEANLWYWLSAAWFFLSRDHTPRGSERGSRSRGDVSWEGLLLRYRQRGLR